MSEPHCWFHTVWLWLPAEETGLQWRDMKQQIKAGLTPIFDLKRNTYGDIKEGMMKKKHMLYYYWNMLLCFL